MPQVSLAFDVPCPDSLLEAAVIAYSDGTEKSEETARSWLAPGGVPDLQRCLAEVLCESAKGPESKIGDRADLWEPVY